VSLPSSRRAYRRSSSSLPPCVPPRVPLGVPPVRAPSSLRRPSPASDAHRRGREARSVISSAPSAAPRTPRRGAPNSQAWCPSADQRGVPVHTSAASSPMPPVQTSAAPRHPPLPLDAAAVERRSTLTLPGFFSCRLGNSATNARSFYRFVFLFFVTIFIVASLPLQTPLSSWSVPPTTRLIR
jgi:hypothetical protein